MCERVAIEPRYRHPVYLTLVLSFGTARMPYYYPAATDYAILLVGAALCALIVARRTWPLVLLAAAVGERVMSSRRYRSAMPSAAASAENDSTAR